MVDDAQPRQAAAPAEVTQEKSAPDAENNDASGDGINEKSRDPNDQHRQQQQQQDHTDHILSKENGEVQPADTTKAAEKDEDNNKDASKKGEQAGEEKSDKPEGGYDSTPIPKPPPGTVGYTLKITFHKSSHLTIGDAQTLSSDPYVLAQLNTDLDTRHKEDPKLRFRTFTIRKTLNAEWNESWVVANVPSSGFKLKVRVYDEDPADHDDLLGKATVSVSSIDDNWKGIKQESYKLSLKQSSKRAVLVRSVASCFGVIPRNLKGDVVISIENLDRTAEDGQNGRPYTIGECRWFRHHSPLLGRLTHTKDVEAGSPPPRSPDGQKKKKSVQRYNFQANQIQLQGPVPAELYHRFVEFKPWVKRMFTTTGFQGLLLGKALHHQHARVYNFGRSTAWGHFPQGPCEEMTRKFLELVHYDQGGRIFTYVLTLDALWRFTETGKEFGIDMLSKHTMHSDVSIYIAFSGEFFVRRLKHRHRPPPPHPTESTSHQATEPHEANQSHPPEDVDGGPPDDEPPKDPRFYQLYIDNDSGTYRPNAKLLPSLAEFMSKALPGLHISTLDCQADEKKMNRLKTEQRERKQRENTTGVYTQDDRSSISSSDGEELDELEQQNQNDSTSRRNRATFSSGTGGERERGTTKAFAKDVKMRQAARWDKVKREYGRIGTDENEDEIVGGAEEQEPHEQQQQHSGGDAEQSGQKEDESQQA